MLLEATPEVSHVGLLRGETSQNQRHIGIKCFNELFRYIIDTDTHVDSLAVTLVPKPRGFAFLTELVFVALQSSLLFSLKTLDIIVLSLLIANIRTSILV